MKIRPYEETAEALPLLRVGDVVQISEGTYMVGQEGAGVGAFMLRELHTGYYANSTYDSLRALTNMVEKKGWKVFPKSEYDLKLVKKGS